MNINVRLDRSFTTSLNRLIAENPPELARLNGLSEQQLSYTDFIDNFVDKNTVADASIDGNANVGTKDICSLMGEMSKPHLKLLAFNKIFFEMNKRWGYATADQWLTSEYTGQLYLHDSHSSTSVPYCYAYDLEDLVKKGLFFVKDFNAQPPAHLETYTDFVGEFVSWTSNRSSGACGLPNFLIYSYYFWKKDCAEGYYIKSPEYYRDQEFQRIIYKLNQPYLRVNQSAFTNFTIFDKSYLVELFGGKEFPDGTFMIDYIDELLEYQKAFMRVLSDIREKNMMTFPVMTFSLLFQNGRFVNEDFARWCCKHNMRWGDSNFACFDSVTSLSNCCRLQSDIKNLGYFNSIGGTALSVGSVKVNTINLARLAYESGGDRERYLAALRERAVLCMRCLDTVRNIIRRNNEKGLLPNYRHKIMEMEHQYNTVGIIGIYETLERFGLVREDEAGYHYYTDEGLQFAKDILAALKEETERFRTENGCDYLINIEQVPAERAAAVLMQKDKMAYPDERYTLPLYANQWIPLAVKTTLKEKARISAVLDRACSGGSIAHFNIATPFKSFDAAWEALNFVAKEGCTYFAFCYRISVCKSNHSFFGEVCPICGSPKRTTVQRIVGFLVPEENYSKERKAEYALREFFEW